MRHFFDKISAEERKELIDSIAVVTVFIAQADGDIDSKELEWANKITNIRAYSVEPELREFYNEVGENFSTTLDQLLIDTPTDIQERYDFLHKRLSNLNPILKKTDYVFSKNLVKSLRSFAKHVAQASGGFAGFLSISKEEAELIDLPMINEVV